MGCATANALIPLWEQDVWWQLRAGDELWQTWRLQRQDEWSYTAYGAEWYNIWWVATLIISAVHSIGGVAGLVVFRGCLASLYVFLVAGGFGADIPSLLAAGFATHASRFRFQ